MFDNSFFIILITIVFQDHYFCEFNMEGLSEEYNEIYLEFQVDNLVTAYRSAQAAKSVKLKLTKKHVPCLTLEVELVMYLFA